MDGYYLAYPVIILEQPQQKGGQTMKSVTLFMAGVVTLISISIGLSTGAAYAEAPPKPKLITVATFDIGASTYAEVAAISNAIIKKFGVKIRVVPIGNSVARAIATRAGSTQIWGSCSSYYAAEEGLFDFATLEWGPQPIQMLYMCNRRACFSPATSKKSGIKSMADVKGKRVGWIVGNPAVNMQYEAYLAFAGLTLDDVKLVKFPGYTASLRGMIAGKVDMILASSTSTATYEIEASPRGLYWIPVPHDDAEGWKRLQAKAGFVAPLKNAVGAGIPKDNPPNQGTYPCPVVVAWGQQSESVTYWYTKMIAESWDEYKDAFPNGPMWHINEALKAKASVPFHKGSVRYFKDKGLWTNAWEKRQQELLKRQSVLAKAFAAARDEFLGKGEKAKKFPAFWHKSRIEALKAAGFPEF